MRVPQDDGQREVTAVDDDVVQVPGQLPLFGEPRRRYRPIRRPDGRLYRPRRRPEALILGGDEGIAGVAVERTHDVALAERLARQVLAADDPNVSWRLDVWHPTWGRWRPDAREDGSSTWVDDASGGTGMPVVFFDVEAT